MPRLSNRALRRQSAMMLSANKQAEARYASQLRGIMAAINAATLNQIGDTVPTAHELSLIAAKVRAAIPTLVNTAFTKMSTDVTAHNAKALKAMGVPLGPRPVHKQRQRRHVHGHRGDAVGQTLAKQLNEPGISSQIDTARMANIALITNAARDYAADVQSVFNDPKNVGLHVKDLTDKLVERGNVSQSRAELIARDQTLKLNGNITQIRQTAAGITSYTWSTSNDERVREEHRELEGQVFTWADPPSVGAPGQDFQCRCIAVPVIEGLEEIFGDEPAAPTDVTPAEEATIDQPVSEEVFEPAPPPPPPAPAPPPAPLPPVAPKPPPPVVVKPVKEPKPPKPFKEPKAPKPAPVAVPKAPRPAPVVAPVVEEPARKLTSEELPPRTPFTVGKHIRNPIDAPSFTPQQVDKFAALLIPDGGHEFFLSRYPLENVKLWDKVEEGANGMYRASQKQIEVRAASMPEPSKAPFELGVSYVTTDAVDTKEGAQEVALIHEFGHHIHLADRAEPGSDFRKVDAVIAQAYETRQSAVSGYAETMKEEYFAETYAMWRKYPDLLIDHDPSGHAMVEEVLRLRHIRR